MSAAVMDCSALVELLVTDGIAAFEDTGSFGGYTLVAPHLLDPEFLSAMRRHSLRRPENAAAFHQVVREFYRLQIIRMEHEPLWPDAWRWRDNLTSYDAMYVSLARVMNIPLVTADERLASAAEGWCDVLRLSELQPS